MPPRPRLLSTWPPKRRSRRHRRSRPGAADPAKPGEPGGAHEDALGRPAPRPRASVRRGATPHTASAHRIEPSSAVVVPSRNGVGAGARPPLLRSRSRRRRIRVPRRSRVGHRSAAPAAQPTPSADAGARRGPTSAPTRRPVVAAPAGWRRAQPTPERAQRPCRPRSRAPATAKPFPEGQPGRQQAGRGARHPGRRRSPSTPALLRRSREAGGVGPGWPRAHLRPRRLPPEQRHRSRLRARRPQARRPATLERERRTPRGGTAAPRDPGRARVRGGARRRRLAGCTALPPVVARAPTGPETTSPVPHPPPLLREPDPARGRRRRRPCPRGRSARRRQRLRRARGRTAPPRPGSTRSAAGSGAAATVPRRRRTWHRATASESAERISHPLAQPAVTQSREEDVLERRGCMTCSESARLSSVDDHAAVEQHDLMARRTSEMEVLGREQDAAATSGEGRHRFAQHDDGFGVERGGRLVDEDQRRSDREGGDRARLPPQPAGERPEALVATVVEAECCGEQLRSANRCGIRGSRARGRARRTPRRSTRRTPSARRGRARRPRGRRESRRARRRSGSSPHRSRPVPRLRGETSSCPIRSARRGRRQRPRTTHRSTPARAADVP